MQEQQRPNWARGLAAVGLALLTFGAVLGFLLLPMILGGLILLCVGVATAGTGGERVEFPKPEQTWEPGDRPWGKRKPE
ncbi:hypothetical protein OTB20_19385 [Streptomyces sp. H27-H1]|uniref:hypothetical protein n=1 Tax=Streptomyces sp. H27-H1 TaxID=2996461 RepID=UPI00227082D7|nr:hypothetical protein [Streptomyces sp. H27-H1]MCY0928320.1 hypothetical protein [Streptomyces sp. H27-H1]